MNDAVPGYFYLLRAAFDAHEREDLFDVRSEDPASLEEYERLKKESHDAQLALIAFIQQHGTDIYYGRTTGD